jgi:hypothetical protein
MAKELKGSGPGNFLKWDTLGVTITGTYKGTVKTKFNDALVIETDEGVSKKANLTYDLADKLTGVAPGTRIRITFVESIPKPGRPQPFKVFKVEDLSDEGGSAPAPAPAPAPVGVSYEQVAAAVRAKLGAPAETIIQMLAQMYPAEPARTAKLAEAARSYGVAL